MPCILKRTTIKDLAKECRVSIGTVSLALRNDPRVADATRERVRKMAARMQYRPDGKAQSLSTGKSQALAVCLPPSSGGVNDPMVAGLLQGLHDEAARFDYHVILQTPSFEQFEGGAHLHLSESRRADGLLFINPSVREEYRIANDLGDTPHLIIGHREANRKLNHLTFDLEAGLRDALDHLVQKGHRRIGYVGREGHDRSVAQFDLLHQLIQRRYQSKLTCEDAWTDPAWSGGFLAAHELLERNPDCTAILFDHDRLALDAMQFLQMHGKVVPRDVSLMSLSRTTGAPTGVPPLTSIEHNLDLLGASGFRALLDLIEGRTPSVHTRVISEIRYGESTGTAPRSKRP